jgi:hypothetical protein
LWSFLVLFPLDWCPHWLGWFLCLLLFLSVSLHFFFHLLLIGLYFSQQACHHSFHVHSMAV